MVCEQIEVFRLPCPSCRAEEEEERMFPTTIPHFGKVIIMAFSCSACGYRNSEVITLLYYGLKDLRPTILRP